MLIVPVHTTRTKEVEVPVDYGPKPEGWDKMTAEQKQWVLSKARDRRHPIWAVMDAGVPSHDECINERMEVNANNRREERIAAIAATVVVLLIAAVAYLVFKPFCWWPSGAWCR